jgi:Pentapeptide repeats (8 copies)
MANPEHLEIFKQGVDEWNQWQKDRLNVIPDFSGADLNGADLSGANLSGADLSGAILFAANLSGVDLRGADLRGAYIGMTTLGDNDLSLVKGLDTIKHTARSIIGVDTIYNSGGKIPEVFLRGCGVPESLITFHKSLVNSPIEFYSCFISYSHADRLFARRSLLAG